MILKHGCKRRHCWRRTILRNLGVYTTIKLCLLIFVVGRSGIFISGPRYFEQDSDPALYIFVLHSEVVID